VNRIVVVVESPSTLMAPTDKTRTTSQVPIVRQGLAALERAMPAIEGMFMAGTPW
jgi:hypothetical protein